MHCPQHLPIREKLKEAADDMEGVVYKTARKAVKVFKIFG